MTFLARIVGWALTRPWLVVGAFLWLAPLSYLALRDLPIEYTPNLAPAQFSIDTQAPGLVAAVTAGAQGLEAMTAEMLG